MTPFHFRVTINTNFWVTIFMRPNLEQKKHVTRFSSTTLHFGPLSFWKASATGEQVGEVISWQRKWHSRANQTSHPNRQGAFSSISWNAPEENV